MIYIRKNKEPGRFLWYRHQDNASFDDMDADVKGALRESLLKEQGYLCAYCMRRIRDAGDVKIEHLRARTPENELQYQNLLAVCRGGEGGPPLARSCDTQKGSRPICISPLSRSDMSRIFYSNSGKIFSTDTERYDVSYWDRTGEYHEDYTSPNEDIGHRLNLNYENGAPLIGRRVALRKFQQLLHPYKDGKSKKAFLEKMQQVYTAQEEYLVPYVGILRWYIDKKLKQVTGNDK